jgi:hypothetical protein
MNLALSVFWDRPQSSNKHRCVAQTLLLASFLISAAVLESVGEDPKPPMSVQIDSDHDGISDEVEQALLAQFLPKFLIGRR